MATRGAYQHKNDLTIDKSFRKFIDQTEKTIATGYEKFMQAALAHLIEVHASTDHHVNEDSTLACGIIHNGTVLKIWGHTGTEQVKWKKATERLQSIVPELPKDGWVGVLLSGMKGWYNVDKEMGHLTNTASWSRDNFTKYFKPLKIG